MMMHGVETLRLAREVDTPAGLGQCIVGSPGFRMLRGKVAAIILRSERLDVVLDVAA